MDKEDVIHIYNGILATKKNGIMSIAATGMDLDIVVLSEVSQRRNIIWHPLHVESKRKWYRWTYKTEADSQTWRISLWLLGEGIVREFGMDMYTLLCLKWITNKDLLCSTWNSVQCYVTVWIGEEFGGERIHVYVWLSLLPVYLKVS